MSAHDHTHQHEENNYYLDQLCLIAVSAAFGGICLALYFWKTAMLKDMLAPQFHAFVLLSGVTLVALGGGPRRQSVGSSWPRAKAHGHDHHHHDDDCCHDHEHAAGEQHHHEHGNHDMPSRSRRGGSRPWLGTMALCGAYGATWFCFFWVCRVREEKSKSAHRSLRRKCFKCRRDAAGLIGSGSQGWPVVGLCRLPRQGSNPGRGFRL